MFFKTILKINLQFCFECILLCPFWVMYVRDGWFGVVSGWGGGFRFWWPCKSVTVRSPLVHWTTENATTMRNGEGDDNCHGGGNIFAATVRMWVHDPWTGIKSPAWHVSALWAQTKQQPTPLAAWGATWFKGWKMPSPEATEKWREARLSRESLLHDCHCSCCPFCHFIFAQLFYSLQPVCYLLHFKCSQP